MNPARLLHRIAACLIAVASLLPAAALANEDVQAVLKRAAAALGTDGLKTLVYSGYGMGASFGQAFRPGEHWPKLNYSRYERQLDYDTVYIRESVMRSRAEPKGGGAVPLSGEAPFTGAASATRAWNMAGPVAMLRTGALAGRLHDLWTTPHGVIKAAMKHSPKLAWKTEGGEKLAAVSFAVPGVMRATAFIDGAGEVRRVESRTGDNVLGEISVVTKYSEYRGFGDIRFPIRIEQTTEGSMTLEVTISEVTPNGPVNSATPENMANAVERVVLERAAEGVWFVAGGSHNSVVIEMKDHLIMVESPLSDERATAVFDAVYRQIPDKPVRYVVNSHSHFDHSGGLRGAVAEGATIVAQAQSKAYFEKAFATPNTIAIDKLARSGRKATVMGVGEKLVMKDATRTVELHRIKGTDHVDTFLMAYLPREKLLIEADAYTPLAPNAAPPSPPNAYHVNLVENIERLKLSVDRILPLHGRIVPVSELYRMIGR